MERGFEYLVDAHGIPGARDIFERICVNLFQSIHGPKAKSVKVSQGDGGIDVLIGDLPSPERVYQCKFFLKNLGASQRQQIKESFNTVVSNYHVKEWLLCLPCILNEKDLLWWSKWKTEMMEEKNVKLELCDGSYLIHQLKKFDIYSQEFDDDTRNKLNQILAELNHQKEEILDGIIYGDIEGIEDDYNDFIFVKMLESANILDTNEYKVDFFNAEIARQESISKYEIEGLKVYNNLKQRIFSIWKSQFREYQTKNNGQSLLSRTYYRIEDLDTTTLKSSNEYHLIAKKGILHHLANEKKSVGLQTI